MPRLPYKNNMDLKRTLGVRLHGRMHKWLEEQAINEGSTKTRIIEQLIKNEMEKNVNG